ncbi:hypothetical protein E1283_31870, partial [Streptomyces hainanensis]
SEFDTLEELRASHRERLVEEKKYEQATESQEKVGGVEAAQAAYRPPQLVGRVVVALLDHHGRLGALGRGQLALLVLRLEQQRREDVHLDDAGGVEPAGAEAGREPGVLGQHRHGESGAVVGEQRRQGLGEHGVRGGRRQRVRRRTRGGAGPGGGVGGVEGVVRRLVGGAEHRVGRVAHGVAGHRAREERGGERGVHDQGRPDPPCYRSGDQAHDSAPYPAQVPESPPPA